MVNEDKLEALINFQEMETFSYKDDYFELTHETIDDIDISIIEKFESLSLKLELEYAIRSVVHDIANPITSINVNIDFLLSQYKNQANDETTNQYESVKSIKKEITKLREKFDDVRFQKNDNFNYSLKYIDFRNLILNLNSVKDRTKFYLEHNLRTDDFNFSIIDVFMIYKFLTIPIKIEKLFLSFVNGKFAITVLLPNFSDVDLKYKILDISKFDVLSYLNSLLNRILPKYDYNIQIIHTIEQSVILITTQRS